MNREGEPKDYREVLISSWAEAKIESFRKPTQGDLENQRAYYGPLIEGYLPPNVESTILEIGCGWGGFLYSLRKFGYVNVDAIDIIPDCCAFVEEKVGVKAVCIDVFDFFIGSEKKYDVIAAFDVLEHFNKSEIVSLMQSIYRSLADGGVFIMRAPYGGSLSGLYLRYSGFTHEIAFTPLSITELFKAVGFSRICCLPEPESIPHLKKRVIRKYLRRFLGKYLALDPNFVFSANIIGIGTK